jgi:predicted transcriptional regulator
MPLAQSRRILAEHLRHPPGMAVAGVRPEACMVISIKPSYARLIEAGSKQVEFRRRFPRGFQSGEAIFYLTSPVRAIAMVARITAVRRASPAALWKEFGAVGGVSGEEFDAYFAGISSGVALLLDQVRALPAPIGLNDPRLRAIQFKPPQSLAVLREESVLREIVGGS